VSPFRAAHICRPALAQPSLGGHSVRVVRIWLVASCALVAAGCSHGGASAGRAPVTSAAPDTTRQVTAIQPATTTEDPVFGVPRTMRRDQQARASAEALCQSRFGTRYLNSAPGTVAEVRAVTAGPGALATPGAFPGAAPRALAAWCWIGRSGDYHDYAVELGFAPILKGGIAGPLATTTPPPGPPIYP
jgi:hypothetical protein